MSLSPSFCIKKIIPAMFLVAGTCIGGGMLALPVATGVNGFIPSTTMMLLVWVMMTFTALLLAEITLSFDEEIHVMTMATRLLGPWAKWLSCAIFILVSYASTVGYTAAGGVTVASFFNEILGISVSRNMGCTLFAALFTLLVTFGTQLAGKVNSILFTAMIGAYLLLLGASVTSVDLGHLSYQDWAGNYYSIPLLLTAFSFQSFLIPSLARYLSRDIQALRYTLVGGTTLTLAVYLLWQWITLGSIPPETLMEAFRKGHPATESLRQSLNVPWIATVTEYFGFFALITSFLGMSVGLYDFLSDSLSIPRKGWGTPVLGLLILIPTLVIVFQFERAFLVAMDASGGFGDTTINGFLPILMVWVLRYRLNTPLPYRVSGGKIALCVAFLFYMISLLIEIFVQAGVLENPHLV